MAKREVEAMAPRKPIISGAKPFSRTRLITSDSLAKAGGILDYRGFSSIIKEDREKVEAAGGYRYCLQPDYTTLACPKLTEKRSKDLKVLELDDEEE